MKKPPNRDSVTDIQQAIELALSFLDGMSEESFEVDLKTQAAVIRQLEIIGEAAIRLSNDFMDRYPDILFPGGK